MKQILLLAVGLLGLGTVGLTSAKADSDYYDHRGDDCDYRRPVYHERYRGDDCDYRPQRRVVIVREYERPYRVDYYRPRPHHRRHVNFFLPVPPLPF